MYRGIFFLSASIFRNKCNIAPSLRLGRHQPSCSSSSTIRRLQAWIVHIAQLLHTASFFRSLFYFILFIISLRIYRLVLYIFLLLDSVPTQIAYHRSRVSIVIRRIGDKTPDRNSQQSHIRNTIQVASGDFLLIFRSQSRPLLFLFFYSAYPPPPHSLAAARQIASCPALSRPVAT